MRMVLIALLILFSSPAWATNWCNDANIEVCSLFDDGSGSTVADSSSNSVDGTLTGGSWVGSVTGTNAPSYATDCVEFNGSSDFMSYGTVLDDISPFSYVSWIEPDTVYIDGIYSHTATDGGGGSASLTLEMPSYADIKFQVLNTSSGNYAQLIAYDVMATNEWQHIAVAWDGTTASDSGVLYRNGVAIDSVVSSSGGTRRGDASYYKYIPKTFDGRMTEQAIFSTQLSSTDINDIMDNGLIQAGGSSHPVPTTTELRNITLRNVTIR